MKMANNYLQFCIVLCTFFQMSLQVDYNCEDLLLGQYMCPDPARNHIDPKTQQLIGCTEERKTRVWCIAVDGINCTETGNNTFTKEMPCKWTNGYKFDTALLLSIFFGMFGADRFYLGYPGMGLLKFCTLGGMFLGQLIDIILIATQKVGPADGSDYLISYYGAGITILYSNNETYRLPRDDW